MFWRRLLFVLITAGMLLSQPVPAASAAALCNKAQFVSDISVPDGTTVIPGAVFTKIWRLKNIGTCTWTGEYSLVFDSGSQMSGAESLRLPAAVKPGQQVDLGVTLAAPSAPGGYRGYWKLSDPSGARFGLGTAGDGAFWVDIIVQDSSTVVYDLAVFAPYASWKSGAGPLPYPGTSGDARGYAQRLDYVTTEEGAFSSAPSLITVPQTKTDGNIQGVYPPFTVQKGDRFQVGVGCEFGSACYVTYRLDYVNAAGVTRNFWTRREMNDKRVFQANVDLSPLAGQTVQFTLSLLATGSPTGDRAVWAAPRIVRTIPLTPPPTPVGFPVQTPTPTPFGAPPPAINPSACDKAAFTADVTVPDGTYFAPGAAFSKTWRLKNTGSCTWTTSYKAYFYSGEQMGAPTVINLPKQVRRGETLDLTVNFTAPESPGQHRGDWVLSNAEGALFGTGIPAVNPFWLTINVSGGTALGNGYDFAENYCAAQWRNGGATLPCPGAEGDPNGFVIRQDTPHMEDGTVATLPGLLVVPQNKYNGYIQGVYPAFTVQPGDRFQTMVGCEFDAKCYVTFRLDYMNAAGTVRTLGSWRERSELRFFNVDQDLSSLAGQSVRFILTLSATGSTTGDRAIWGAPHIQRRAVVLPSTPTPTPSPTLPPPGADWLTYTNPAFAFQFKYPAQSVISGQTDTSARIDLPYAAGTNLRDKFLTLSVHQTSEVCRTPMAGGIPPTPPETVVINGISWLKESWLEGVMGQTYDWTAYSTPQGSTCVSLGFVLRSLNPGAQETPLVPFDKAAESVVFGQIVNTFAWLPATPTPTPTLPPIPEDWLTGSADHIRFKYPSGAQVVEETGAHVRMNLPIVQGTNLHEKYLDVRITENATSCANALNTQAQFSETVTINGTQFLKESGGEGAAGSFYDWVAYSSLRNGVCASMGFVLHSHNPGAIPTETPLFDKAYESIVFGQIINTFLWLIPPPVTPPTAAPYLLPDLTIGAMRIELGNPSCLQHGDSLGGRIQILNNGEAAASSFVVRFGEVEQTVDGLGAGQSVTLFFPNYMYTYNPVTVTVDSTSLVLESNELNNTRTESLAVPTAPLPCPESPTPGVLTGPYAVALLGQDVLPIHQEAGLSSPVVGAFPPDTINIMRTGVNQGADGSLWVQVMRPDGGLGWVDFKYLTEYVTQAQFCADARVPALIAQVRDAVAASNGIQFASLVSPKHGVSVNLWSSAAPVNYTNFTARTIFTDTTPHDWGTSEGAGGPSENGSFAVVVQPKLAEVLNSTYQLSCDDPANAGMFPRAWPYMNIHYYAVVKPGEHVLDWRIWLFGFEYADGNPYLFSTIYYVWAP